MGTTVNNTNKVINNTMVNINLNNFIVNGHQANTTSPGDCLCLDLIKVLFNNAKLPFTANMVNGTYYIDQDGISHVTYTIHTDISAMDNPVKTIADMDLVLGKYINWEDFINSYPLDWEYQVAGFYDYNDQLVIVFKSDNDF